MGDLLYEPPRDGATLWEIGIPDRSAAEFYVPDPDASCINRLYVHHPDRSALRFPMILTLAKDGFHHRWCIKLWDFFSAIAHGLSNFTMLPGLGSMGCGADMENYIPRRIWSIQLVLVTILKIGFLLRSPGAILLTFIPF